MIPTKAFLDFGSNIELLEFFLCFGFVGGPITRLTVWTDFHLKMRSPAHECRVEENFVFKEKNIDGSIMQ